MWTLSWHTVVEDIKFSNSRERFWMSMQFFRRAPDIAPPPFVIPCGLMERRERVSESYDRTIGNEEQKTCDVIL